MFLRRNDLVQVENDKRTRGQNDLEPHHEKETIQYFKESEPLDLQG